MDSFKKFKGKVFKEHTQIFGGIQSSGTETDTCKGTTKIILVANYSQADTENDGDWYSDC